ncbi:MAG: EI24 domain-containing protein [Myxococcales bacterium]|nr:EI24 domain-containing protein [Myxococcales bacterium]
MNEPNLRGIAPAQAISCILGGIPTLFGDASMRRQMITGVLVNAVAFLGLFVLTVWGVFAATSGMTDGGWLLAIAGWIARIALTAGLIFITPVLFMLLSDIVRPMFNGKIFMAARTRAGGENKEGPEGWMNEARVISNDLRRLVRLVVFSLLILPLNLIPVVGNAAYFLIQTLIVCHTMGWDLMGYHFELHGFSLAQQKVFCKQNRAMILGIGAVGTLLCLVPIVQFFFVSTNVAGSGLLSAAIDSRAALQ